MTLETPANRVRVIDPRIQVTGRVSSGAGVRRVVVTLNAVEVARLEEAPPRPVIRLNVPVTLRRGQNVLLVTAEDTTGETIQEARTVFYDAATEARAARGLLAGPGPVRVQAVPPAPGAGDRAGGAAVLRRAGWTRTGWRWRGWCGAGRG